MVSLLLNGQLAPGSRVGFSSATYSRARSSECSGPRRPGPHHRPGPPHRTAGVLPSPSWRAVRVLTGSQGSRSATCIGLLHLNQFPVSLHLGRDQGAEGVQVTSRTAEIFPETKRTADESLHLRPGTGGTSQEPAPPKDPTPRPSSPRRKPGTGRTINQAAKSMESTWGLSHGIRVPRPPSSPQYVRPVRSVPDSRTCRALASPNLLYPRRPNRAPWGGPESPSFHLPGRNPVWRPRVCPACCSPAALPAPLRLCPSSRFPRPSQVPDLPQLLLKSPEAAS